MLLYLSLKNILMSDVEEAIKLNAHSEDAIQCIINDDNSSNLIMRVRVKSETEDENFLSFFKEFENKSIKFFIERR